MIEFLTLFLGIVAGPQQVSLLADPQVTAIELRLDGESLTRIEKPPWQVKIDLGTELLPHVLEAVAFGSEGEEVARTTQLLNVPRPAAEITLVLDRGADGELAARLAWESSTGAAPTEKIAFLDEKEVPILEGDRIDLSGSDPRQLHVLQVELWFSDLTSARGHLAFGGGYLDEMNAELTAVPVLTAKGSPDASEMSQWFVSESEPLRVVAVEKGLASLMIVRGPGVSRQIASLKGARQTPRRSGSDGIGPIQARAEASSSDLQRNALPLDHDIRVRLVVPRALRSTGQQVEFDLFSVSPEIRSRQGGLLWILTREVQVGGPASKIRLQDAVTLAGLQAAGSDHRRAVLLILADPWEDHSRFEVAAVRGFLESLNVPLFVWTVGDGESADVEWGSSEVISTYSDLKRAWRALEKSMNRQRVVWLEGFYLPNAVEIAPEAGVESVLRDNQP